ncbi:Acid tolerance regulatory protein ActR [Sterolibacterium denitrificans]|uniref:Acid tolerance regulatory protein ActR n=1 Tax=Sterolibacterium denitrificans TaxID=157592 RepID=A0A7Z7HR07_9PROT|nr:response regulator [Sterolibacterium denitrificans]SMB26428.1 Acid tolerance regulatory protein ActR [Sterolibacterium denitrificans]
MNPTASIVTATSRTILVIDDDAAFNAVLCRALGRRGHVAFGAGNAAEALEIAKREQPQRIVLDLNLAGRSGNESGLALLAPLRQHCPHSRIVLLTGYASIATAVDAIKLGADHYLAKPVDVDTLLASFAAAEADAQAASSMTERIASQAPPSEPLSVDRLEWEHIQRVLHEHEGNISATARALKMHRRTLQRKLGKHPVRD